MDCKIRDIGLVKLYLTWQHTAFNKPRDSAASFRMGRKREAISESEEPPPAQQNPIASLNVLSLAADFALSRNICCVFYDARNLSHCRGPPYVSEPRKSDIPGGNDMLRSKMACCWTFCVRFSTGKYKFFATDALWDGQTCLYPSGKEVKGDKQPPPRVWRGVKTWNFHRPRRPASVISLRYTAKR